MPAACSTSSPQGPPAAAPAEHTLDLRLKDQNPFDKDRMAVPHPLSAHLDDDRDWQVAVMRVDEAHRQACSEWGTRPSKRLEFCGHACRGTHGSPTLWMPHPKPTCEARKGCVHSVVCQHLAVNAVPRGGGDRADQVCIRRRCMTFTCRNQQLGVPFQAATGSAPIKLLRVRQQQ